MRLCIFLLSLLASCSMSDNSDKITIHGHRGCRGLLPENTMPSFYKALDLGVDALEIDLVCTGDGQLLISHDPFIVSEICTKPDGTLITPTEEKSLNIYKMTMTEAQSYICGTLVHPRFIQQQQLKTYKPSFVEFVSGVREYCKKKNLSFPVLNIEIKSEAEWDSIYQPFPRDYAKLILKEYNSLNINEHALIQSFDPRILEELNQQQQGLKLMLLIGNENKNVAENLSVLSFKPYAYCPHFGLVDEVAVSYCKQNGVELIVWTVNEEGDMQKMLQLGVRNIITDYPDRANRVVAEWKKN